MTDIWLTAILLIWPNLFMTAAWYGHLRFPAAPVWVAILGSWGIALFEYCVQVPANRLGYHTLSAYQLKTLQEVITLVAFSGFAGVYLGEAFRPKHLVGFLSLVFAVWVINQERYGMRC